jgi:hypothetical protein
MALTGFARAAFIDWKLMVANAITKDTMVANTNTQKPTRVR